VHTFNPVHRGLPNKKRLKHAATTTNNNKQQQPTCCHPHCLCKFWSGCWGPSCKDILGKENVYMCTCVTPRFPTVTTTTNTSATTTAVDKEWCLGMVFARDGSEAAKVIKRFTGVHSLIRRHEAQDCTRECTRHHVADGLRMPHHSENKAQSLAQCSRFSEKAGKPASTRR
jgi:hypothetical protein